MDYFQVSHIEGVIVFSDDQQRNLLSIARSLVLLDNSPPILIYQTC